jgi:SAM-dependent methyltransferase
MLDKYPRLKFFLKKTLLPIYLRVRSFKYAGNNVYCPCCGGHFSRFLEVGPKREPMLCPRCRSNDRDRYFWLYLEKNPDFFRPGIRLLHIGPETIYYNRFRKIPGIDYVPGDKFILQFGSTYPPETVYVDITDMPQFPDNHFDFIFCSHVLEYIPDDRKALREQYRVLKPGAKAIISVPIKHGSPVTLEDPSITDPDEQARIYGDTGHIRYYGEDYPEKLRSIGFRPVFTPVTDFIPDELIKQCVINPNDAIQLSFKD